MLSWPQRTIIRIKRPLGLILDLENKNQRKIFLYFLYLFILYDVDQTQGPAW
jgi:hypothetical protein